jgi:hypothetical protein
MMILIDLYQYIDLWENIYSVVSQLPLMQQIKYKMLDHLDQGD